MNEIKILTLEKKLTYDNTVILTYTIDYPQIVSSPYSIGKDAFNKFNKKKAMELKTYSETDLFRQAKETYEYNKKYGYPIMVYEVILTNTITYQSGPIISLFSDEYLFTGGAHGLTTRTSQNWNLKSGTQIPLIFFFHHDPNYVLFILQEIIKQIELQNQSGDSIYFDNYCSLVIENLNLEHYYITKKGIVIYFQQYEIAPYSSGIREFLIPFKSTL